MHLLVLALSLATTVAQRPRGSPLHRFHGTNRIVGGTPLDPATSPPWIAAIHPNTPSFIVGKDTWRAYCGGSLVRERWIISG